MDLSDFVDVNVFGNSMSDSRAALPEEHPLGNDVTNCLNNMIDKTEDLIKNRMNDQVFKVDIV